MNRLKSRLTNRRWTVASSIIEPSSIARPLEEINTSNSNWHSQLPRTPGGDDNLNDRTGIGVGQSQASAKFGDPLSHSTDPHSHAVRPELNYLLFDSLAIVADRNCNAPIVFIQADRSISRSRMPEHIGQGFLDDAEDRSFQLRPKPAEIRRFNFQANIDSA